MQHSSRPRSIAITAVLAALISTVCAGAVLAWNVAAADAQLIKIGTERTPTEFQYAWGFAALKQDGSVVPWGDIGLAPPAALTDVRRVYTASHCIATLHTDGSVTGWGRAGAYCETDDSTLAARLAGGVVSISSTSGSFAAIKDDGSVVAWGDPGLGGSMSGATQTALDGTIDVVRIVGNGLAFAALRADGSVVTWGSGPDGGNSSSVQTRLVDIVELMPSYFGFAARTRDGAVVSWGGSAAVPSTAAATLLQSGVTRLFANRNTFAARKADGSIVPWDWNGADPRPVGPFTTVEATEGAFAGIRADGSVATWGERDLGGDSSAVASRLGSGVVEIMANEQAFAARKADGSVVTWGLAGSGGDSTAVASSLSGGVSKLAASLFAFAAIRDDGSAVAWGDAGFGGSLPTGTASAIATGVATDIVASDHAFAVVLTGGSVAAWGVNRWGGDQLPAGLTSGVVRIVTPFYQEPSNPAPGDGGGAPAPGDGGGAPAPGNDGAAAPDTGAPRTSGSSTGSTAPSLPVQARLAGRRVIVAAVRVDGPGRVTVVGMAGSATACRASKSARKVGTVNLRCRLSKAVRATQATSIVLTATFAPKKGSPVTGTTTVPLTRR